MIFDMNSKIVPAGPTDITPKKSIDQPQSRTASTNRLKLVTPHRVFQRTPSHNPIQAKSLFDRYKQETVWTHKNAVAQTANTFKLQIKQLLKEIAVSKVQNNQILKNLEHARMRLRQSKQNSFREINKKLSQFMNQDQTQLSRKIDQSAAAIQSLQSIEIQTDFLFQSNSISQTQITELKSRVEALMPSRQQIPIPTLTQDLLIVTRHQLNQLNQNQKTLQEKLQLTQKDLSQYQRMYQNQSRLNNLNKFNELQMIQQKQKYEKLKQQLLQGQQVLREQLVTVYYDLTGLDFQGDNQLLIQSIKEVTLDKLNLMEIQISKYKQRLEERVSKGLQNDRKLLNLQKNQQLKLAQNSFINQRKIQVMDARIQSLQNQLKNTVSRALFQQLSNQFNSLKHQNDRLLLQSNLLRGQVCRHDAHRQPQIQSILQALRKDNQMTRKMLVDHYQFQLSKQNFQMKRLQALQKNFNASAPRKRSLQKGKKQRKEAINIQVNNQQQFSYIKYIREMSNKLFKESGEDQSCMVQSISLQRKQKITYGAPASTQTLQLEEDLLGQFDYRRCSRCKKNQLSAPRLCQAIQNGKKRVFNKHQFKEDLSLSNEVKEMGKLRVPISAGVNTIVKMNDFDSL